MRVQNMSENCFLSDMLKTKGLQAEYALFGKGGQDGEKDYFSGY